MQEKWYNPMRSFDVERACLYDVVYIYIYIYYVYNYIYIYNWIIYNTCMYVTDLDADRLPKIACTCLLFTIEVG